MLRDVHGRGLNSLNDMYMLPADPAEMDRLTIQHRMWCLMIGGLYPLDAAPIVEGLLQQGSHVRRTPAVLDIGSGSGIWTIEIATAFPHARVVGLDLVQSNPTTAVPPNCRFATGDATLRLPEYAGEFDVVHCRTVAGHLSEATVLSLIRTIGECLRPGGVFIFADGNWRIYGKDRKPLGPAHDGEDNAAAGRSWFARWFLEYKARSALRTVQQPAGEQLGKWLLQNSLFEDVQEREYWSPVNWAGENVEKGEGIGELMKFNVPVWFSSILASWTRVSR